VKPDDEVGRRRRYARGAEEAVGDAAATNTTGVGNTRVLDS
jgi:hypothetical protein